MDDRLRPQVEPGEAVRPIDPGTGGGRSTGYQIRVRGHVVDGRADRYAGLAVTLEDTGNTLLHVPVIDQAALYGLLRKLRDLGVPLISVNPAGLEVPASEKEMTR